MKSKKKDVGIESYSVSYMQESVDNISEMRKGMTEEEIKADLRWQETVRKATTPISACSRQTSLQGIGLVSYF